MSQDYDDEDYYLPLEDQRVFGAGIRRKRVPFVRSGELNTLNATTGLSSTGTNIADTYLSIVLKQQNKPKTSPSTPINPNRNTNTPGDIIPPPRTTHSAPPTTEAILPAPALAPSPDTVEPNLKGSEEIYCDVCKLLLSDPQIQSQQETTSTSTRPHEASLAHQVCLKHSHPPSHLDRTRTGMRYLSTYGWDPDSRLGLGAPGREGIREPLKGRVKHDTAGLGSGLDKDGDPIKVPLPVKNKVVKLNPKDMRRKEAEAKKRGEKMRNLFFQSDEVLKYLGESA